MLSPVASRAVLLKAIKRVGDANGLGPLADVSSLPGVRRRLERKVRRWSLQERHSSDTSDDRLIRAEQRIHDAYQAICIHHRWVDKAGLAVWGSRIVRDAPGKWLAGLEAIAIVGPLPEFPFVWRAIEAWRKRCPSLTIALTRQPSAEADETSNRILEWGFTSYSVVGDDQRPEGLVRVERDLFAKTPTDPAHGALTGISIIGSPERRVMARVVAREVTARLDNGAMPEDLLVLLPRGEPLGSLIVETLESWGVPARTSTPKRLAAEPVIATIERAVRWPVEEYDAVTLVGLWRNTLLKPDWPEASLPENFPRAASAVQMSRAFRGRESLRRELAHPQRGSALALRLLERFLSIFDRFAREGTWSEQTSNLQSLIKELGLDREEAVAGEPLGALYSALDQEGEVLASLEGPERISTWAEFVARLESTIALAEVVPAQRVEGVIQVAALDEALGAWANHIIVAGLGEGTFPDRTRLDADENTESIANEEQRFLSLVGSAQTDLSVIYPTRKDDGQPLLAAGFVEDLIRLFSPEECSRIHTRIERVQPALIDEALASLARSAADVRVRTVGLALQPPARRPKDAVRALQELARQPIHQEPMIGTAIALSLLDERTQRAGFGIYEGRWLDFELRDTVARNFGPSYTFSASQLESYNLCPFQFFMKYVLRLAPRDERDEFETDRAALGTEIHRVLETLERTLHINRQAEISTSLELDPIVAQSQLRVSLDQRTTPFSPVVQGLRIIEDERLVRMLNLYLTQREKYLEPKATKKETSVPEGFEIKFGNKKSPSDAPALQLGSGSEQVLIQGSIDRVDLVSNSSGGGVRIIDYKSGTPPEIKDVKTKYLVQLPVYAMAVERLNLLNKPVPVLDFGYWGLRNKGFRSVRLGDWDELVEQVESLILAQVSRVRDGRFEVNPRVEGCETHCDYAKICRIKQVRMTGKAGRDLVSMEGLK